MTRPQGASVAKGRAYTKRRLKPDKTAVARKARKERQALQNLAEKRQPFESLLEQIVAAVLCAESPKATNQPVDDGDSMAPVRDDERWLEVGCGLGQLRSLLPSRVRDRVIHTDLSGSLVHALVERHPEARALAADVTRLPFESASVDAVLGLCAFDSFPSPGKASREIGRVLREGGRFIHFLDAATNVEPVIVDLVGEGRLPLPNFFADIALRDPQLFDTARLGHFIRAYHDVLSVPLAQFEAISAMLQRADHPLAKMLQRYSAVFLKQPFEILPAARTFVKLTSDPATGRPMSQALMSLFTTLQQPPYREQMPFELSSHSSLAHFKARLEHYFGSEFGYELWLSDVVYARAYEPDAEDPVRARTRRVGIGQNREDWPDPTGIAANELSQDLPNAKTPGATLHTHVLREAAIYCLVSAKMSSR